MKKTILILIMLLIIPSALAICCERNEECIISETCQNADCGNTTITIYNRDGSINISQSNMTLITTSIYTFNNTANITTDYGTYPYTINSTTGRVCQGDCQVEVKAECFGTADEYYLYIVAIVIFFAMLGLGYYKEEPVFVIIAGMLSCVIAIALYQYGFPKLTNEFLKHGIIIILAGIGFYFILAPTIEYFEELKGSFGGKLE